MLNNSLFIKQVGNYRRLLLGALVLVVRRTGTGARRGRRMTRLTRTLRVGGRAVDWRGLVALRINYFF